MFCGTPGNPIFANLAFHYHQQAREARIGHELNPLILCLSPTGWPFQVSGGALARGFRSLLSLVSPFPPPPSPLGPGEPPIIHSLSLYAILVNSNEREVEATNYRGQIAAALRRRVLLLRKFRDQTPLRHRAGSAVVALYQHLSPALADFIRPRAWCRRL